MNLYEILFKHYSQGDSQVGVHTYLVANSDEDVYDFIANRAEIDVKKKIDVMGMLFVGWDDYEEECEEFKDETISIKGDMFSECPDLRDLYYGKTLAGWQIVKEDISVDEIKVLENCGIRLSYWMGGGNHEKD